MTPRPTLAVNPATAVPLAASTPLRLVIVTMDTHLASATERARQVLARERPGLSIHLHAASEYAGSDTALAPAIV